MKLPASTDIERVFLATLIVHSELVPEYISHLTEGLCHNDVHRILINGIINLFNDTKSVDAIRLSEYISNIGLASKDDVDVVDYIHIISKKSAVNPSKIGPYFKDLYKFYIARKMVLSCNDTVQGITQGINGSVADLVGITEKNLAKCLTVAIEDDYKPVDLYKGIGAFLEGLAENSDNYGISTPFPTWNRWWGPLTEGDLTIIAAPAKAGKSTMLAQLADTPFLAENKGKNVKVLYLDTELETSRVRTRKIAAASGVNEFFIKSGAWKKNTEMRAKVQKATALLESKTETVKHQYVANVPMDQVCGIVRRWAALDTEPDDLRIVIYDYLKLTGEKKDNANLEWQILGDKCDTLKHLCAEEGVKAAGIAAVQTNAQRDVAASQRIKWFVSNLYLLWKKGPEELSEDGKDFGTHVLEPFEMRNLGPDWINEEYIKTTGKEGILYKRNYLNLNIKDFHIEEAGTLAQMMAEDRDDLDIDEEPIMEAEELL